MTVRKLAYDLLLRCESAAQYSNIAVDTALRRNPLSSIDRGFFTALVYGVIERRLTLDFAIEVQAARKIERIDLETRTLLRMGLYQLAFMDRVPDHAAVNETVSLAPRRTRGFVNAILRSFLRENKQIAYPDAVQDPIGYLSAKYSFLPEICKKFVSVYGFSRTEALFAAFGKQAPLTLRVNTLKTTRESLLQALADAGYEAKTARECQTGLLLSGGAVAQLPGFDQGLFFVQDEASQLCVEALDAKKGTWVLDACACPGSKSFGAAIDMQNCGRVLSCDLHANKLSLVSEGAARLGIDILETCERDARSTNAEWLGRFDRVLCDVPCSGFGVFAKKPELRYKDPASSAALPDIQLAILQSASGYLKKGGLLVYSTCTLLPEENEENVARFVKGNGEFSLLRQRTLTPDIDGTDGFYFAVLQKI